MELGYARVSTAAQETALQLDALKKAGVKTVFVEACSGVGPRPELQRLLQQIGPGDLLVVWKIDRVARSLSDLLQILAKLKKAGASIRSLTEPIDTSTPIGEFTIQILGAVAQLERSIIRERIVAGQKAAKDRGQKWGTRPVLDDEESAALLDAFDRIGTIAGAARSVGVNPATARRYVYIGRPDFRGLRGRPAKFDRA